MTSKLGERFIARALAEAGSGRGAALEYGAGAVDYGSFVSGRLYRTDVTAALKDGRPRRLDAVCDLQHLPFRNGSFDLIFGVAVLPYVPDLDRAMTECRRLLSPGGRLLIFEYRRPVNIYNQLRGQGYAHTLGLRRLGRALEKAGFEWVRRPDIAPDYGHRWPVWLARRRWLVIEARPGAAG